MNVAFFHRPPANGTRTYVAMSKTGDSIFTTTVPDHGHGAHIAHQRLTAAGHQISGADWAYNLARRNSLP